MCQLFLGQAGDAAGLFERRQCGFSSVSKYRRSVAAVLTILVKPE
jgi:hypothetical protein